MINGATPVQPITSGAASTAICERIFMPPVRQRKVVPTASGPSIGLRGGNTGRIEPVLLTGADTELTRLPWVGHRSPSWEPEPLRWLGMDDPAAAQATFQQLYGYRPELPSYSPWPWPDAASWQNLGQNLLPEFKLPSYHELAPEQRRIGPFQDLNRLQISFKLVDEGVRVVLELMPR